MAKNAQTLESERLKSEFYQGMANLRKEIKEISLQMGRFFNGFGEFVEGLTAPAMEKAIQELGFDIRSFATNVEGRKDAQNCEVDVLAIARKGKKKCVIVGEAKSKVTIREINTFLNELDTFFEFFEDYKGKELIGMIAGVRIPSGVKEYAEKKGLYILAPSGDSLKLLNSPHFKPRVWK